MFSARKQPRSLTFVYCRSQTDNTFKNKAVKELKKTFVVDLDALEAHGLQKDRGFWHTLRMQSKSLLDNDSPENQHRIFASHGIENPDLFSIPTCTPQALIRANEAHDRLDDVEKQQGELASHVEDIKEKQGTLETRQERLETRVGGAEDRVGVVEEQQNGLGTRQDELETRVGVVEEQQNGLGALVGNMQTQLNNLANENTQLWNTLDGLGIKKPTPGDRRVTFSYVTIHEHGMVEGTAPFRNTNTDQEAKERRRGVKFLTLDWEAQSDTITLSVDAHQYIRVDRIPKDAEGELKTMPEAKRRTYVRSLPEPTDITLSALPKASTLRPASSLRPARQKTGESAEENFVLLKELKKYDEDSDEDSDEE